MTSGKRPAARRRGARPSPLGDEASERDRLVTENIGLAEHLARRFTYRGESYEDLVQVASMGLVKAADRFDPARGFEFSTFATKTILGDLKHHFRDKGWAVRAPRQIQELYLETNAVTEELSHELGRSPTVHEIAVRCQRSDEEVLAALEAGRGYHADSLDAPGPEGESVLERWETGNVVPAADNNADLLMRLAALPDRDQTIMRLRFVDELSQSEIAEQLGISQMHVSRLLRDAIQALRESFVEEA